MMDATVAFRTEGNSIKCETAGRRTRVGRRLEREVRMSGGIGRRVHNRAEGERHSTCGYGIHRNERATTMGNRSDKNLP